MGGISVLVSMSAISAVLIILAIILLVAVAMFIGATVVSIVFLSRGKKRREQNKKLGGLIALPLVLYAISIPVLVVFATGVLAPFAKETTTVEYYDCSTAITTHDAGLLESCLDASELDLPVGGVQSYSSLLNAAIRYEDPECAEVLLRDVKEKGIVINLDEPLQDCDEDGEVVAAECPLIDVTAQNYSSLKMIRLLIEYGAEVNCTDSQGRTPLHNACEGLCTSETFRERSIANLEETEAAIDVLLESGADISAQDQEGLTSWDLYKSTLDEYVREGCISTDEAKTRLSHRAEVLNPA